MARGRKDPSITQSNDGSCTDSKRRQNKRTKTKSNKKDRQKLKKDLNNENNL